MSRLQAAQPIVFPDGTMQYPFREMMALLSREIVLTGSGSPEGNVEAFVGQRYMDTAGTAGNIQYVKRDADVGGDTTKGWILV